MADRVMVNSSWTRYHIQEQWNPKKLYLLYPPVDVDRFKSLPLETGRLPYIISLGQFRKEKSHELQIEIFSLLLKSDTNHKLPNCLKLLLIGSTRQDHPEDQERLAHLKRYVEELNLSSKVKFMVNLPREDLQQWLGSAVIGLHTMKEEHFGIGIVEMMSAGVIPVVHNSGGPMFDIVTSEEFGFRAETKEEFRDRIAEVLRMTRWERIKLQESVRERSFIFSDSEFQRRLKPCCF